MEDATLENVPVQPEEVPKELPVESQKKAKLSFGETFAHLAALGQEPGPKQSLKFFHRITPIDPKKIQQPESRLWVGVSYLFKKIQYFGPRYIVGIEPEEVSEGEKASEISVWKNLLRKPVKVDRKLLFHVLGDVIGSESKGLKGQHLETSWSAFLDYFKGYDTVGDPSVKKAMQECRDQLATGLELLKKLRGTDSLDKVSEEFRIKLTGLKVGESLILPDGWTNDEGGHAIVHELVKEEGGTFRLLVHNAGDGIEYHQGEYVEGKRNTYPYVLEGIPLEKLCSKPYLASLRDIETYGEHNFYSKDMYKTLLPSLGGTLSLKDVHPVDIQRSGTCSVASIFSFFQTKMVPRDYLRNRIVMGLQLLHGFAQKSSSLPEGDCIFAQKCSRFLSQLLLQAKADDFVTDEEFSFLHEQISLVNGRIGSRLQELGQSFLSPTIPAAKKETKLSIAAPTTDFSKLTPPKFELPGTPKVARPPSRFVTLSPIHSQEELLQCLTEATNAVKTCIASGEYEAAQHIMEAVSRHLLKVFKEKGSSLGEGKTLEIIQQFHYFTKVYVENIIKIAQQNQEAIVVWPSMAATLCSFIQCSQIAGEKIPEIRQHSSKSLFKALHFQPYGEKELLNLFFERHADEESLYNVIPLSQSVNRPPPSELRIRDIRSRDKFRSFAEQIGLPTPEKEKEENSSWKEPVRKEKFLGLNDEDFVPPKEWFLFIDMMETSGLLAHLPGDPKKSEPFDLTTIWRYVESSWQEPTVRRDARSFPTIYNYEAPPAFLRPGARIKLGKKAESHLLEGEDQTSCQLRIIGTWTKALAPDGVLTLFLANPELLVIPEKQIMLEQFLFSGSAQHELPEMMQTQVQKNIAEFVSRYIRVSTTSLNERLYCLRLARLACDRGIIDKSVVQELIVELEPKLEKEPTNTHARFLFHKERALFLLSSSSLSSEDLENLVASSTYAVTSSVTEEPYFTYELRAIQHELLSRDDVRGVLTANPSAIINKILGTSSQWKMDSYPNFVTQGPPPMEYQMARGILLEKQLATIPTPSFFAVTSDIQRALGKALPNKVSHIGEGCYEFELEKEKGVQFRVLANAQKQFVQKKIGEAWYQYVPPGVIEKGILPQFLASEGRVWWNEKEKFFRIECPDGTLYEAALQNEKTTVFVCDPSSGKRTSERLVPASKLRLYLQSFEDKEYIIASTTDGKNISKIKFSRLGEKGLTFIFDAAKKEFRREDIPTDVLVPDQTSPVLHGPHKLVLRSTLTNQSYILISGHYLGEPEEKAGVTPLSTTRLSQNAPSDEKDRPFIPVYMCKKEKGELIPESSEARASLAYLYLSQQEYEKSAHVLDGLERIPLSQEVVRTLLWMCKSKDTDARAIAVRLRAAAQLKRQQLLFDSKIPDPPNLTEDTREFLSIRHAVGWLQLSPEDQMVLKMKKEEKEVRRTMAGPISAGPIVIDFSSYLEKERPFDVEHMFEAPKKEEPTLLRPIFSRDFWDVCEALRTGRPVSVEHVKSMFGVEAEGKDLTFALEIAARTEPSKAQTAAAILLAIQKSPDQFKDINFADRWKREEEIWKELMHRAASLFEKPVPSLQPPVPTTILPLEMPEEAVEKKEALPPLVCEDPEKTALSDISSILFPKKKVELKGKPLSISGQPVVELLKTISPIHAREGERFAQAVTSYSDMKPAAKVEIETEKKVSSWIWGGGRGSQTQKRIGKALSPLKSQLEKSRETANKYKHTIVDLLQKRTLDTEVTYASLEAAGYVPDVYIKSAIIALLKPFPEGFLSLNPALSVEDASALKSATVAYLAEKTHANHLNTIVTELTRLKNKSSITEEEVTNLHALLDQHREYDIAQDPRYLVLEEALGYIFREDQLKVMRSFLEGDEGKVIELIMGSGKTAVIGPLLCQCIASRGKLPVFVIPESLASSMFPQLAATLQNSFSQKVFSWEVPDNEMLSVERLSFIEQGIKNALAEGGAVLARPKDITGLFLQFFLTLKQVPRDEEKIELFQSIFSTLIKSGEAIFDEADSTFDVLKEHLLATGEMKAPSPAVLDATMALYQVLKQEKFYAGTKAEFEQKRGELINLLMKEEKGEVEKKKAYLESGDLKLISQMPAKEQERLRVWYTELWEVLPETYTKKCGVEYGAAESPDAWYAVPYDRGNPVPASRFKNELEEINFTYQFFVNAEDKKILPLVSTWVRTISSKIQQRIVEDPAVSLETIPEVAYISDFLGKDIANLFGRESVETITQAILDLFKKDLSKKVTFARVVALPNVQRPTSYVRCTTQLFAQLFSKVRGFTGTLWNQDSYPLSVTSETSPESVGKTMHLLENEMDNEVALFDEKAPPKDQGIIDVGGLLCGKAGHDVAQRMLENSDPESISGVIFYENKKQMVLERNKSPYPLSQCKLPKEKLAAFWEQQFTVGSDLRLGEKAQSTVLVGKHTMLRDLLQGIWRMRQFGKGQKVHFATDEETAKIIRQTFNLPEGRPITVKHIFAFALKNQTDRLAVDNPRAFEHKASAFLEGNAIQELVTKKGDELTQALEKASDLFFQEAYEEYGIKEEEIPIDSEIERIHQQTISHKCAPANVEEAFSTLKDQMQKSLPQSVPGHRSGGLVQIQQQAQAKATSQVKTAVRAPVVTLPEGDNMLGKSRMEPFFLKLSEGTELPVASDITELTPQQKETIVAMKKAHSIMSFGQTYLQKEVKDERIVLAIRDEYAPMCNLGTLFGAFDVTKEFSSVLSRDIYTSTMIYDTGFSSRPYSRAVPTVQYMVCYQKGDDVTTRRYLMLSRDEAETFTLCTRLGQGDYKAVLINIHSGAMYHHPGSEKLEESLSGNDQVLSTRVQAKIYNGFFRLTPEEQLGFLLWCIEGNKWDKVKTFLQDFVLVINPFGESAFPPLEKILEDKGESLVTGLLKRYTEHKETKDEAEALMQRLAATHTVDKEMIHTMLTWMQRTI